MYRKRTAFEIESLIRKDRETRAKNALNGKTVTDDNVGSYELVKCKVRGASKANKHF